MWRRTRFRQCSRVSLLFQPLAPMSNLVSPAIDYVAKTPEGWFTPWAFFVLLILYSQPSEECSWVVSHSEWPAVIDCFFQSYLILPSIQKHPLPDITRNDSTCRTSQILGSSLYPSPFSRSCIPQGLLVPFQSLCIKRIVHLCGYPRRSYPTKRSPITYCQSPSSTFMTTPQEIVVEKPWLKVGCNLGEGSYSWPSRWRQTPSSTCSRPRLWSDYIYSSFRWHWWKKGNVADCRRSSSSEENTRFTTWMLVLWRSNSNNLRNQWLVCPFVNEDPE